MTRQLGRKQKSRGHPHPQGSVLRQAHGPPQPLRTLSFLSVFILCSQPAPFPVPGWVGTEAAGGGTDSLLFSGALWYRTRPTAKGSTMDVLIGWTWPFCLGKGRGRARSWDPKEAASQGSHEWLIWPFQICWNHTGRCEGGWHLPQSPFLRLFLSHPAGTLLAGSSALITM